MDETRPPGIGELYFPYEVADLTAPDSFSGLASAGVLVSLAGATFFIPAFPETVPGSAADRPGINPH
jgi:hypothetical protein